MLCFELQMLLAVCLGVFGGGWASYVVVDEVDAIESLLELSMRKVLASASLCF